MRTLARRHPVLAYYLLVFAISWGGIVLVVGPAGMFGTAETIVVAGVLSVLGPSTAGIVLSAAVDGPAGLRRLLERLLRWRVAARWYAVALLTGPAVMVLTLLALAAGDPSFVPAIVTTDDRTGLILSGVAIGLFVATFEELGWTGFATPHLLERHGVLASGLLMGVLWGTWHFPLFSGTVDSAGVVPQVILVPILLFAWLPPYRVLMTWLYARTGSVLLAILMHAPIVACQYVLATDVTGTGRTVLLLAWGAALWAIAIGLEWRRLRSPVRGRAGIASEARAA